MKKFALALAFALAFAVPALAQTPVPGATAATPDNTLVIELKGGKVLVQLMPNLAPKHVERVKILAAKGFYDGVKFHRVMKTFVAQFGINGDPKIDQLYSMMRIGDDPPTQRNKRGTITYAKLGADSRTTEVFINLRDNPVLDSTGFAPFGKIVEGLENADKLAYLYGELAPRGSGPDASRIHREGNVYLNRDFPRLDAITKATILVPPK